MAEDNDIIARLKVEGQEKFKADLLASSKSADTVTASVTKMEAAIKEATDPKDIKRLTNELEAVKIASEAGATAFESSKAKLRAYKEEATGLATVLATLKLEGKQNTQTFKDVEKQFESTKKKAGQLSDQINDVNQEIKSLGSDTRGIDLTVRGIGLMANGFQFAEGAAALLGKSNEDLQKALVRLNGVMAITQSIQQIGNELTREDSIFKLAAAKATGVYNAVVGTSTGALKAFKIALAATGIGLVVILIGTLVANWDKLSAAIGSSTKSLEEYNEEQEKIKAANSKELDDLEKKIRFLKVRDNLTEAEANDKRLILLNEQKTKSDKEYYRRSDQLAFLKANGFEKEIAKETLLYNAATITKNEIDDARNTLILKMRDDEKKSVKKHIEEIERLSVPVPLGVVLDEQKLNNVFDAINILIQRAEAELIDEFSINPNSESLEPLSARLRDLQRQAAILKVQMDRVLNPQTMSLADVVGNIPELPSDPTGEGDLAKKPLTLYERLFGTAEENMDAQKSVENKISGALKIVGELNKYGDQISSIAEQAIQIRSQNELAMLEDKKNRGLITEKEYEKQSAAIKNEAARKKRAIDIANATAQIPVAVLSAYIAGFQVGGPAAPVIAGILAGIAGAFGIAQVALIASAPLPKFREGGSVAKRLGLIKGAKHEQGGVPIEVEGDEFVMKAQATKKYGVKMLDDINNLKFNPVISAGNKINAKRSSDMRLYENLSTISSYLKQGYKIDAKGNEILKEISGKLRNKSSYV